MIKLPEIEQLLKKVIFRLDFLGEIKLSQQTVDHFKRDLSEYFPEFGEQDKVFVEVLVNEAQKTTKEKRFKSFSFKNDETNNSITLEPYAIILEVKEYITYEDFKEVVQKINRILEGENSSAKISRIGLRYINQIIINEGNPLEWTGLIKDSLISSLNFVQEKNQLSRLMGIIELNRSDYLIRFQYGWFNSEYPNPIAKKEFLLDYDCYSENETDISAIIGQIDMFHSAIKDLFNKSILDGLNDIMDG